MQNGHMVPTIRERFRRLLMGYTEREHWCQRDDKKIYGKLFLPDGWDDGRPRATAIFAHGLSTNHGDMEPYARTAAERGMVTPPTGKTLRELGLER